MFKIPKKQQNEERKEHEREVNKSDRFNGRNSQREFKSKIYFYFILKTITFSNS